MQNIEAFQVFFEQAYLTLGKMHEKGLGVEKNQLKAEEYYLRAGSRGGAYTNTK